MDIQEFFYITASIAFILFSVLFVALIYMAIKIQRIAKFTLNRVNTVAREATDHLEGIARTWGALTITKLIINTIKTIFRR